MPVAGRPVAAPVSILQPGEPYGRIPHGCGALHVAVVPDLGFGCDSALPYGCYALCRVLHGVSLVSSYTCITSVTSGYVNARVSHMRPGGETGSAVRRRRSRPAARTAGPCP